MTSRPEALFIGAANLDRHASLMAPHVPATSNRGTVMEIAGGVSLNIASRFAACGGKATLMTALGDDAAASMIRRTLSERGVELEATIAERTGTFASILQPDGELVTAVSDMAAMEDFNPKLPDRPFDWLMVDANLAEKSLTSIAEATTTRLALATVSVAKAPRLTGILGKAAIVFTNIPELAALSGGAAEPFQWFRKQSEAILVASDGPRPLWLMNGDEVRSFPIVQLERIVDVVGAGDALAGTMLHALASGAGLTDALATGLEASTRTVQIAGPYLPPDR